MNRPRILLADDHALVAEGIRKLLEPDFDVVATVEDGHALVRAARELRPDVVLLDISMPLLNGIDAARQLKRMLPQTRLVFLTMHAEADYVAAALEAGASAYLLKSSAPAELVPAIRDALAGRTYITPLVGGAEGRAAPRFGRQLSPRQRQVLQLVAEGYSSKEIAGMLGISSKTVDFHRSAITQRLGIRSTAELTRYALDKGLTGA